MADFDCRRCGRPVQVNRSHYDVFEQMHYVCFHYEFEHDAFIDGDPDGDCGVPGCPSAPAIRQEERLATTIRALLDDWSDGPPANWDNHSIPDYLTALLSQLENANGHYASRGIPIQWNSWEVIQELLRAATVGE